MKIYVLYGEDCMQEFFPTKKAAIERAKAYGGDEGDFYVDEHEIGKRLTKAVACRFVNGGFSYSRRKVWP